MSDKSTRKLNCAVIIRITAGVLLIVSAVVMYLTHRNVPFMMDDEWYATKLSSEEPITNLRDIVEAQIWHYQNWGGRSMTHAILQMTLLAGEQAADILNVAVTFLLAALVCLVSKVRSHQAEAADASNARLCSGPMDCLRAVCGRAAACFPWMLAAVGMLLGLNANWKMSMFWQAGAANYLYITVFILAFLWCYLREIAHDSPRHLPGITLWILPLGLLVGWSNENMGPAVWILTVIVMFLLRRDGRPIHPWMWLGSLACLAGSVIMIIAPGNSVRSAEVASSEYGTLWQLFLRCYAESTAALDYLFPALLVLGALLVVSKCILRIPLGCVNILLLLGALLSWGAMILSPHYPDRATFGTMALLICVILRLAAGILHKRRDLTLPLCAGAVLIWLRGMYFLGEFLSICWGWIK